MDSGDIVRIAFFLLIVGSFVLPWMRSLVSTRTPDNGRAASAGPKSFTESGGYRPVARRPVEVEVPVPLDRTRRDANGSQGAVLPERGEARLAREEAAKRGPSAGSQPTAEERTRRRPIAPLIVTAREIENAGQIRTHFRNPQAVRTAIIMREVLDRPVSLREDN